MTRDQAYEWIKARQVDVKTNQGPSKDQVFYVKFAGQEAHGATLEEACEKVIAAGQEHHRKLLDKFTP